ncbi:MAG: LysM peptidoglycan-binding domain-containing protein [Bacillaceae bacterium]|nr:LysM peptidoglycan-binding domain-containing protein [Bacillaceae bacterium]
MLELFTHYKINQSADGIELILFLSPIKEEFSQELGGDTIGNRGTLESVAFQYVKKYLPNLKVKTIKIMAGAMVVTSLGMAAITPEAQAQTPNQTHTPQNQSGNLYTVVNGDTLSQIAARNGTTVQAIRNANQLSSDLIRVGQSLVIPTSGTVVQAPVQTSTYTVVAGDTLSQIAARNGTTVQAIRNANQLSSDLIRVGQTLVIPTGSTVNNAPAATQPVNQINQEELHLLAQLIFAEARGESLEGQIAVGAVIMNRMNNDLFPYTVHDVIFEVSHGHHQFTPAGTGSIFQATPDATNLEAARRALQGEDPTNGSLYFYNPDKTNDTWVRSRTVSTTIGNHVFAY